MTQITTAYPGQVNDGTRRRIFSNAVSQRHDLNVGPGPDNNKSNEIVSNTRSAVVAKEDKDKCDDVNSMNSELPLGLRVFRSAVIIIQAVMVMALIILCLYLFFWLAFEQMRRSSESHKAARRRRRNAGLRSVV